MHSAVSLTQLVFFVLIQSVIVEVTAVGSASVTGHVLKRRKLPRKLYGYVELLSLIREIV